MTGDPIPVSDVAHVRALLIEAARDRRAVSYSEMLAVLVVRESDGMPGQGWWVSPRASLEDHAGSWEGPEARAFVDRLQREAFDHWSGA